MAVMLFLVQTRGFKSSDWGSSTFFNSTSSSCTFVALFWNKPKSVKNWVQHRTPASARSSIPNQLCAGERWGSYFGNFLLRVSSSQEALVLLDVLVQIFPLLLEVTWLNLQVLNLLQQVAESRNRNKFNYKKWKERSIHFKCATVFFRLLRTSNYSSCTNGCKCRHWLHFFKKECCIFEKQKKNTKCSQRKLSFTSYLSTQKKKKNTHRISSSTSLERKRGLVCSAV